jgi:hypothetical protein
MCIFSVRLLIIFDLYTNSKVSIKQGIYSSEWILDKKVWLFYFHYFSTIQQKTRRPPCHFRYQERECGTQVSKTYKQEMVY